MKRTTQHVTTNIDTNEDIQLLEFEVKIREGFGLEKDSVRHCYASETRSETVSVKCKRFLMFGWTSSNSTLNLYWSGSMLANDGKGLGYLADKQKSIYVGALIPTNQAKLVNGSSFAGRTYLNLAQAWQKGMEPSMIRATTG